MRPPGVDWQGIWRHGRRAPGRSAPGRLLLDGRRDARLLPARRSHGGRRDRWQLLGELFDGSWGWRRTMPMAHNTPVPAAGHGDLVEVATWGPYDLWRFLR